MSKVREEARELKKNFTFEELLRLLHELTWIILRKGNELNNKQDR